MAKTNTKPKAKKVTTGKLGGNQVASARKLVKESLSVLWNNKRLFVWFVILYGLLTVAFVRGPQYLTTAEIKSKVQETIPDSINDPTLVAGVLVSETSQISQTAAVYAVVLYIIFSLAMIWLLRAVHEGKKVRLRDGFYYGMHGLVPVILIASLMLLQLIPVALGALIHSVVTVSQIATNSLEEAISWMVFAAFGFLTLSMFAASIQAIYIATLPEVTPMEAIRRSRMLVKNRRAKIILRMLVGLLLYGFISFVVLLVIASTIPVAGPWWWWIVGILALPIGQSYFYSLYRSLL